MTESIKSTSSTRSIIPRFIRVRDAPAYLGMDPNRFRKEVRPQLTEIRIGTQGVAFDRLELDSWADAYKARHGRRSRVAGNSARKAQRVPRDSGFGAYAKAREHFLARSKDEVADREELPKRPSE